MDYIPIHPVPPEGRLAIVTDAGRDAVDAAASGADEAAERIPRKGSVRRRRCADDHAVADGPSRVIPAHRLAP